MPVDIGTARQLWWGIAGLGIVQLIASVVGALPQRHTFAKDIFDKAKEQDPQITLASAELMVSLMYVFLVLLGLGAAAVALVIVHQFALGKLWARTLLTVLGVWLVFSGVGALVAIKSVVGVASLLAGGTAIVQAVFAGGAIYLSHRPESTTYFLPGPRSR